MQNLTFPIAAFAALFLTGCGKNADDTVSDAAAQRDEINQSMADVRKDADETSLMANESEADAAQPDAYPGSGSGAMPGAVDADAMIDRATTEYELAVANAEQIDKVAAEQCDALDGEDRSACLETASEVLATAIADAAAQRDMARMDAERQE